MKRTGIKCPRLAEVATQAVRGELYRQLAATGGNVKAAAINMGYSNPHSFYGTLKRFGIKLERKTVVK